MANDRDDLKYLESLKYEFGSQAAERKKECLDSLKSARLTNADQIVRLHETLCFMRAWPDDEASLAAVDALLDRFGNRHDLKQHSHELANSGIAGTPIEFSFYAVTAIWLADHWPDHLQIDWEEFDKAEALLPYLSLLASYSETPGLDGIDMELPDWINRLKGPKETDAAFLIRRLQAVIQNEFLHEQFYDGFDFPLTIAPGPDVPSRTHARYHRSPINYQTSPLDRTRPIVAEEIRRSLAPPKLVSRHEGQRLVDLAHTSMVTRQRDLDAFAYADPHDVSLLDDGSLQFVIYGVLPQRRFLLETLYGILILKNGVPISYGAVTCLFESAEVAYTVFDTFRGGESARIFARALAVFHHVFGCDTFTIDPYQIGSENDDALKSGAWWFYQKLGFRPRSTKLLRLMNQELAAIKRNPKHRSSLKVLRELVTENLYLFLDQPRDDVAGILDFTTIGLKITDLLATRFGSDREQGERTLSAEAADRLGVTSFQGWSASEKVAWSRWSPLVALLPGLDAWEETERENLVKLMRAKGGRQELDYLRLFNRHHRLREALARLATS